MLLRLLPLLLRGLRAASAEAPAHAAQGPEHPRLLHLLLEMFPIRVEMQLQHFLADADLVQLVQEGLLGFRPGVFVGLGLGCLLGVRGALGYADRQEGRTADDRRNHRSQ